MLYRFRILLIEGPQARHASMRPILEQQGFQVVAFNDPRRALQIGEYRHFDLAVLDTSSTKKNWERTARRLAASVQNTPLIVIGAESSQSYELFAASEVLVRPFSDRELLNCIRRYTAPHPPHEIAIGPARFDPLSHTVWTDGKANHITPKMADLLLLLFRRKGKLVRREVMMQEIWRTDYTGDMRTVDVHMSWLRKAIEPDPARPRYIKTIRGLGYRLDLSEAD